MSITDIFKFEDKKERFNFVYKKVNAKKILNIISSAIAQRFGIFIGEIQPIDIQVETVRGCNFRCIMCDAWKVKRISFLSFEESKKILNQFSNSIFLTPYGIGEPFLNRDIYDIVKYASFSLKFIVGITSNFSVIDPQKAINMGANEIMASIDSLDPEKFFLLRKGNLDRVIENLKTILSLKQKNSQKFPTISIRTLISNENIDELENIVEVWTFYWGKEILFSRFSGRVLSQEDNSRLSSEDIDRGDSIEKKSFKNKANIIYLLMG
jgi:molybdenum cofactor biosynthesis enzyme MoaA